MSCEDKMHFVDELRREHEALVKQIGATATWSQEKLLLANDKIKAFKQSMASNRSIYEDNPSDANKLVLTMLEQGYAKALRLYVDNLTRCAHKASLIRRLEEITRQEIELLEGIKTSLLLELE